MDWLGIHLPFLGRFWSLCREYKPRDDDMGPDVDRWLHPNIQWVQSISPCASSHPSTYCHPPPSLYMWGWTLWKCTISIFLDVHKFPLHTVQPRTFLIPPLCQTVKNRERILSLHPKIVQSTTTHLRKSPNHTCKSSCKAKKQEKSNELPGHEVCAYSLFARYWQLDTVRLPWHVLSHHFSTQLPTVMQNTSHP